MRPLRCFLLVVVVLGIQVLGHAQSSDNVRLSITKNVMDEIAHAQLSSIREKFSPNMKDTLSENDLNAVLNELAEVAGPFQQQISQSKTTVNGTPTYISRSQFENFKVELKLVFNDSNQITDFRIGPVSDLSPESMEAAAKEITNLLRQEQFDEVTTKFDDELKDRMPVQRLDASWAHIMTHLGQFKSIKAARKDPDLDRVDVRCEFENGPMIIRVEFDPTGRVSGLWMMPAEPETDSQT